mgnify:CR=1 FL=1
MTKITWKNVKELCDKRGFFYVSFDDDGRKVLRCNNGWIQSRWPDYAVIIVRNAKMD